MPQIVYVNGAYRDAAEAMVSFEDRGYQFADGVYEVVLVRNGRQIDAEPHLRRLQRSLNELDIPAPCSLPALGVIIAEVLRRNRVRDGLVYLQVTRGVAPRDHVFPSAAVRPALICAVKRRRWPAAGSAPKGVAALTVPDERWARCDIKSVSLLPNVLAKEKARQAGAGEAIMVSAAGVVHEGGSSNVWIVDQSGALRTHPLGSEILGGVTRATVLTLAEQAQIKVVEDPFTQADLMAAREVFVTSATSFVKPVVAIDGVKIGAGEVGPVSQRLFEDYNAYSLAG